MMIRFTILLHHYYNNYHLVGGAVHRAATWLKGSVKVDPAASPTSLTTSSSVFLFFCNKTARDPATAPMRTTQTPSMLGRTFSTDIFLSRLVQLQKTAHLPDCAMEISIRYLSTSSLISNNSGATFASKRGIFLSLFTASTPPITNLGPSSSTLAPEASAIRARAAFSSSDNGVELLAAGTSAVHFEIC